MTAIGAFLIICCFWNLGSSTLMHAGMKRHNKCIILAVRCMEVSLGGFWLIDLPVPDTLACRVYLPDISPNNIITFPDI